MLTFIGGMCCVGCINPVGDVAGVWRQRIYGLKSLKHCVLNRRQDDG
jgi:hypothetical protein